ncbi:MAG: hypothetical protein HFJ57_04560 [Clostridia bacterium]|nr:hypothetical protein [Clostridia bacterium]
MSETKLSITKEQAEAFSIWKKQYVSKIDFAEEVLRQELGKKAKKVQLFRNFEEMKETIEQLEISEGSAKFSGEEITSDMRFGFKVSGYIHALWNALFKEQGTKKVELGIRLFEEPAEKLSKIFNL